MAEWHKYIKYEKEKKKLIDQNLSPEDYKKAIEALSKKLKI